MLSKTYNIKDIPKKDYKYSRMIEYLLQKNSWKNQDTKATYSNHNNSSIIKTYLDGTDNIFLKHKLAEKFKDYIFMPETIIIKSKTDLNKIPIYGIQDDLWFLKPSSMLIGSGEGINVLMIQKDSEFRSRIEKLIDFKTIYILQKNINNPLLENGIKFDLRIFAILVFTPVEIACYIFNLGNIRYAIQKYNIENQDKKSHMTNVALHKLLSESELKNIKHKLVGLFDQNHMAYSCFPQIKNITSCVMRCIMKNIMKHKPDNYGFIPIGMDILITDDYQVKLIEVNQHPTLYTDSTSIETAMNYQKYLPGILDSYWKNFYELVFESLIQNKLMKTDIGNWEITNHYKFRDDIKCHPKIVIKNMDISLYELSLKRRDVSRYAKLIKDFDKSDIKLWADNNFTLSRIINYIADNYDYHKHKMTYIVVYQKKIIGIVGLNYRMDRYAREFRNNYFTHIILKKKYQGQGLGLKALNLLIELAQKMLKPLRISKIYMTAYQDNLGSIKLHEKAGFKVIRLLSKNIIIMSKEI